MDAHTDRLAHLIAEGDKGAMLEGLTRARRLNDMATVRLLVCRLAMCGELHVYGRWVQDRPGPGLYLPFKLFSRCDNFLLDDGQLIPSCNTLTVQPTPSPFKPPAGSFELPASLGRDDLLSLQAGVVLEFCEAALDPIMCDKHWRTLDVHIIRKCVAPLLRQARNGKRPGGDWSILSPDFNSQMDNLSPFVTELRLCALRATTQSDGGCDLCDFIHRTLRFAWIQLPRFSFPVIPGRENKTQTLLSKLLLVGVEGLESVGGGWE